MRVFSTFTGIGGFELGIQNAYRTAVGGSEETAPGDVVENGQGLLATPQKNISTSQGSPGPGTAGERSIERPLFVGYSEIDKHAIPVYERHFKGVKNYGDITKINAEQLPNFDCLVGGFPCQAFSIAGKRAGFDDTRGTLFFDLARILRAKRPRLFVFENVKGLLSHDGGRTFTTIISTITELGYDAQWQVVNSKNHGVPQNRERIIIVGHLRGTARPQVFPLNGTKGKDIARIKKPRHSTDRVYDTAGSAPAISAMQGGGRQPYIVAGPPSYKNGKRSVRYTASDTSPTIRATHYKNGDNQPRVCIPEATKKGYAEAVVGQAINLSNPNSKTRRGRVSNISPTIETSHQVHTLTVGMEIRKLTPLECERLQAFPDYWTQYYANGETVSDSQRYKMCGNAVTTNVIQAVFEGIFRG